MDHYTEHSDSPTRLELVNQAGLPALKMRALGTLAVLAVLALAIPMLMRVEPQERLALVIVLPALIAWCGFVLYGLQRRYPAHVQRLRFDAVTQNLTVHQSGHWLWFPRTLTFKLSEFYALLVRVGAEKAGGEQPLLDVRLELFADSMHVVTFGPLRIEAMDRRDESLDFIFRLARAMGWQGYRRIHDDLRFLSVELCPQQPAGGQVVPASTQPMDYAALGPQEGFREPSQALVAFNRESFLSSPYSVKDWEPGRRVEIERHFARMDSPGREVLMQCILLPACVVLAVNLAYLLYVGRLGLPEFLLWTGIFVVPAVWIFTSTMAARTSRAWRCVLDFEQGVACLEFGKRVENVALDAIDGVTLHGRTVSPHLKPSYAVDLSLHHQGKRTLIYASTEQATPGQLYEHSLPMAVELARALEVPWFWEEFSD
ncbi:MAG: hypothetical protein H0U74_09160 [Bradymonadaceae bacterium]|nr:hypothetical protein [Lujinxingiaceae bacterium]